jgi:hypothetical protein
MNSLQLCVILNLALEIHLLEHLQGRFLCPYFACACDALGLDSTCKLPTGLPAPEAEGLTVISSGDDLVLRTPEQALERQELGGNGDDSSWRLLRATRVDDGDAAVMSSKGKAVSAGRERYRVHPASRVVHELSTDCVEGKPLTPDTGLRPLVDTLDEAGEHTSVGIGRSRGEKDRVRVPVDAGNGAADGLLQVLRHPPIVLLLEVANCNKTVARADSKLGLGWGPTNKRGSAADSEQNESWFVALRGRLPHKCIAVLGYVSFKFRQPVERN